jgi:glycosyltransferase involved in cell wall biosynthesis
MAATDLATDGRATARRSVITIIIPALNEQDSIEPLERELLAVVDPLPYDFEFLVVDNCSSDRTGEMVKALCARDKRWRYLRFSRNFTVEMSMTAGYHFAGGDAMIVLYSDLQDPPDVIPRFIEKWREGYDVVYGVRTLRPGDPRWRNFLVKVAYRIIAWMSDVDIPTDAGDYRLISRAVRDALGRCGEHNRYMRGLIAWLGFRQIGVKYVRHPREKGVSKAPLWHLVIFVFNAITSFSLKPLRMFSALGFVLLGVSIVMMFVYIALWWRGSPPPGITTIVVLLFVGIGLNSLGIGVLGEYVGRTYGEVKRRPLYVVEDAMNMDSVPAGVKAQDTLRAGG